VPLVLSVHLSVTRQCYVLLYGSVRFEEEDEPLVDVALSVCPSVTSQCRVLLYRIGCV